jgi:hypothetical protein
MLFGRIVPRTGNRAMSPVSKLAVAALAILAAVACSSTPRQAAAPSAPTPDPPPAAAATNTAGAAEPQVNPKLVSQGYKPVKAKNEYVYCRMEAVTGTQFKKRICLTEARIRELEDQTRQTQDSMSKQRTGPACFPNVNC